MRVTTWFWSLAVIAFGCGAPTGDVRVLLGAESSITEGLDPGSELEDVADGWSVRFSKYVVAIGHVRLVRSTAALEAHDDGVTVIDLAALPPSGLELARFEALEVGRWDHFEYATPRAGADAIRHESVSEADFEAMVAGGWTHLVEGTLESPEGQSCPPDGECRPAARLTFRIAAEVETLFGPCEAEDGLPGVTVTEAGSTVSITLHGDHVFFDAFPSGAEVIERRAQWLANADTDADGAITPEELMALDAAAIFPSDTYNLAGAAIPVETAWDFVRAQLATQGHFQGEGECPWELDGVSGGHDH